MEARWLVALRDVAAPFLLDHEVAAIERNISADDRLQDRANNTAAVEQNPVKLINFFKSYIFARPQEDPASFKLISEYVEALDRRVMKNWEDRLELEAPPTRRLDISTALEWLPEADNQYSLGRYGSTRVSRITARLEDIGTPGFSTFWAINGQAVLDSIPKACLRQLVTDETDVELRTNSYSQQRLFLVELAKAIARVRGVTVDITWGKKGAEDAFYEGCYLQRPDSFFRVGDIVGDLELKTRGDDDERKVAVARGQVVILGNSLWRLRTRYEDYDSFENEVYGFVGTGVELQCLRQIHSFGKKVKAYDGPLLPLTRAPLPEPGESFTIDLTTDATMWAAAAVDRMVMAEATRVRAASQQVNKDVYHHDYGTMEIELRPRSGYWIGDQYLHIPTNKASFKGCTVTILGATRNNEVSAVLQVEWNGELWWLKAGADVTSRQSALQASAELPTGAWERWFQTERDMLSRALLADDGSAFPVSIVGDSRPAMLSKDSGVSMEQQLLSRNMAPSEVHEMSKQVYELLQACGKKGVFHGDVCLENICYKDGRYSLIDWGLACGRPFSDLLVVVDKAWSGLDVTPGVPNWEMSPECCFDGLRPFRTEDDLESLLYCCLKILEAGTLPWSNAASSGTAVDIFRLRTQTVPSLVEKWGRYLYQPLLLKLGYGCNFGGRSSLGGRMQKPSLEANHDGRVTATSTA